MRIPSFIFSFAIGLLTYLAIGYVGSSQLDFAAENSPYEHWDEVTVYNNAGALMHHRQEGRAYAVYGMADTGKYMLARALLERESGGPEPAFSNNRPQYWDDPKQDAGAEFGYARGIPDRRGFLLARQINVIFASLLAAGIVACLLYLRGKAALAPIAGLLLVITGAGCMEQSRSALPNTANAILAFALLYFCLEAAVRRSRGWLAVASGIMAAGINHKFDFLSLGIIPATVAVSLLIADIRKPKELLKTFSLLVLAFFGGLLATCPINTWVELKNQFEIVGHMTSNPASLDENLTKALFSLRQAFTLKAAAWQPDTVVPFVFIGSLFAIGLGWPLAANAVSGWRRVAAFSTVVLAFGISLATPIIKANTFYGRYLLNGTSLMFAAAGFGLAVLCSTGTGRRYLRFGAWFLSLMLVGLAGYRLHLVRDYQIQHRDSFGPLSLNYSRSRAVTKAAELAEAGSFSKTILVDQHAYIDLRYLRQKGFTIIPIHCKTFLDKLNTLPPGKHLVVFTTGNYTGQASWAGNWEEPIRQAYEAYQTALKALPVVEDYPGKPMQLLDWQPPQPGDWITLSFIERTAPTTP